jgi:predicted DNA-binding transcriptional regulator AlpA
MGVVGDEKLRTRDFARIAGVCPETILNWYKTRFDGFPQPWRIGKRMLLWDQREVTEWVAAMRVHG